MIDESQQSRRHYSASRLRRLSAGDGVKESVRASHDASFFATRRRGGFSAHSLSTRLTSRRHAYFGRAAFELSNRLKSRHAAEIAAASFPRGTGMLGALHATLSHATICRGGTSTLLRIPCRLRLMRGVNTRRSISRRHDAPPPPRREACTAISRASRYFGWSCRADLLFADAVLRADTRLWGARQRASRIIIADYGMTPPIPVLPCFTIRRASAVSAFTRQSAFIDYCLIGQYWRHNTGDEDAAAIGQLSLLMSAPNAIAPRQKRA